ncbi:peptidylprolyl isomerase [Paenibacillus rhizovicinus]|uniref:Foldase protein PrsA n=1 Tax=Paenibacillus rhizovicinus TaxID=2704463 RepID=A0A6C0NVA5_9BACL|nr:peptidylprolyl isomerase [Paenibacillus rhizovicinus]QHW30115.1 peptidylprolyl isomerase [Paenibacillus rhizovicinus]
MNEKEKDLKQDNELSLEQDNKAGADTEESTQELAHDREETNYSSANTHDQELEQDAAEDREEEEREERNNSVFAGHAPGAPARSGGKSWMYISLGLALILIVVLVKPPFGGGSDKKSVASVNGVSITKDQLYDQMVKLGGSQTVENMIQEELINQEADKAGVKITDADVNKEIDYIKKQFPTEADFESALQQNGMTLDDLKAQTPMQLTIRKILEPKATVTEKDIEDYFKTNKAKYDQAEEVKASHILVATKEEADAILKQLNEGADFATLAKEKSTDGSKDAGGDLGFFGKGVMDPAFEKAAFALKVGETTKEPVKTQFGYHIIKVTDHKDAKAATLADKKEEIKEQLVRDKVSELSTAWLDDVKSKAKITNTLAKDDAAATDTATGAAGDATTTETGAANNAAAGQ